MIPFGWSFVNVRFRQKHFLLFTKKGLVFHIASFTDDGKSAFFIFVKIALSEFFSIISVHIVQIQCHNDADTALFIDIISL